MNILVTGGTGFIGRSLCERLVHDNHNLFVLTRTPNKVTAPLNVIEKVNQLDSDINIDIVINLAGEPIADKRWSITQQNKIIQSRLIITQELIDYFKTAAHLPKLFISGSAIGYYGTKERDLPVDETQQGDESFSSLLCQQWESTAMQAEELGVRTCLLRTGIVIGKNGGALAKMLPAFKLGLGGKLGSGKQWMSWIHLEDLVGIILFCIEQESLSGAINGTAPLPVTNKAFTEKLGEALKRPTIFSMPAVMVKMLMGKMGEELLLTGSRVWPVKILNAGYQFRYRKLEAALAATIDPG